MESIESNLEEAKDTKTTKEGSGGHCNMLEVIEKS